jgi:NAD(P)-dependent dehydrogenase (short-subunit alcohol dehydrogenase family)
VDKRQSVAMSNVRCIYDGYDWTLRHLVNRMNETTARLFDLSGKVAVVTGAARGLGAAMAQGLAGAGAKVLASDIQDPVVQPANGVDFFHADVSRHDQVKVLIQQAVSRFGRLDVMVCNAAIGGGAAAEDETEAGWDSVMNVNAKGVLLCAREAANVMREQGCGCIINTASVLSFIASPTALAYCASKGAIAQMTRVMAVEWAKYKIRVNAGLLASQQFMKPILDKIPLGRGGEPDEIVGTTIYLASDASRFMTGTVLVIDGGEMAAGGYTDAIMPFIYDTL